MDGVGRVVLFRYSIPIAGQLCDDCWKLRDVVVVYCAACRLESEC